MNRPTGDRILIVWWGSSKGGTPTLGDYMAVSNVVGALQRSGAQVDVAAHHPFDCHGAPMVNWFRVNPNKYRCVAFVCGPLSNEWYFRLLFFKFRRARKVAVGVSVLDPQLPGTRLFDEIVARDGLPESHFDLALAEAAAPKESVLPSHIAVCLRGHQSEYGDANCHADRIDKMIMDVARNLGRRIELVSTAVGPDNTAEHIRRCFAEAELVITTRLHGALLALHYRKPFVAIDQIEGGRKVSSVIGQLGWKHLYTSAIDETTLDQTCRSILTDPQTIDRVNRASQYAHDMSRRALERATASILRHARPMR